MLARSTATLTPKGTARHPTLVKSPDPHNPDNNTFVLVKELVVVLCCVYLVSCCVLCVVTCGLLGKSQLKLAKHTPTDHGGRRRPTAAMVPH